MNIVSLLPNATEIVCAMGYGDHLVGCSHECDYPAWIANLPACTKSKVLPEGPSKTIDANVQNLVQQGLSVYEVDGDQLQKLQPDVIITQMQCELCAASPDDVHVAVEQYLNYQPKIVTLMPNTLQEVWEDFDKIGEGIGDPNASQRLKDNIEREMADIAEKASHIVANPRTAIIEWIDPLMFGGNWIPKLVEYAGGLNLFTKEGQHSPIQDFEALASANPDKIIVTPCGFDMTQTKAEMATLEQYKGWQQLDAVKNKEIYIADGHQYFNRSGPRLLESLKILGEILHPSYFDYGMKGKGWEPWYQS